MGTEVLLPQDCLVDRFRVSPPVFPRRRSSFVAGNGFGNPKPNNNTYGYRKTANLNRPEQPDRKRKPTKEFQQQQQKPAGIVQIQMSRPRRSSSAEDLQETHGSKSVTNRQNPEVGSGLVTILRRGQSLESLERNIGNEDLNNKPRHGSEKKVGLNLNMKAGSDVYAGSGFFVSPSPSSLPLPSFFSNKKLESDNSATRDLRRLLGLNNKRREL